MARMGFGAFPHSLRASIRSSRQMGVIKAFGCDGALWVAEIESSLDGLGGTHRVPPAKARPPSTRMETLGPVGTWLGCVAVIVPAPDNFASRPAGRDPRCRSRTPPVALRRWSSQ